MLLYGFIINASYSYEGHFSNGLVDFFKLNIVYVMSAEFLVTFEVVRTYKK